MPVHQAKILLAAVGLLVFFFGVRLELVWLRWAGMALVAVAWLLRFYRPKLPVQSDTSPEDS